MPLTRVVLLVIAVVACAWFTLSIRQVSDQREAQRLIEGPALHDATEAARARHLLARASELNPDAQPDLIRAVLELRRGENPAAQRTLVAVTRREPENITAWYLLQIATAGREPALNARAGDRVRELAGRGRR